MMGDISIVGLYCEDIREEAAGTHTVVGILPENINFPKWPAIFPKLCLYVRFLVNPSFDPGPISVHWIMPDGSVAAKVVLDPGMVRTARETALANKSPIAGFISKFVASPLQLGGPGRIQAVVYVGDQSFVCGSLYVNVQPEQQIT